MRACPSSPAELQSAPKLSVRHIEIAPCLLKTGVAQHELNHANVQRANDPVMEHRADVPVFPRAHQRGRVEQSTLFVARDAPVAPGFGPSVQSAAKAMARQLLDEGRLLGHPRPFRVSPVRWSHWCPGSSSRLPTPASHPSSCWSDDGLLLVRGTPSSGAPRPHPRSTTSCPTRTLAWRRRCGIASPARTISRHDQREPECDGVDSAARV